ncbi:MAG: M48 family metallopeptidase [Lachnospiraceae bacterium]|nr:M48 family metallopeptidase [Lachnospiraceae bacterium]
MKKPSYRVIRSNRKTISLQIHEDGLLVRAPQRMTDAEIAHFINDHRDWIEKNTKKLAEERKNRPKVERLSMEEIQALADQALQVIPERVKYYAPQIGVTYGRITIRNQRSRWGSCSAKGNLNFNCLLMLAPPEVVDAVVVHELCHRKVMNHSHAFYEEVHRVYPDYDRWAQWLRENGGTLLRRMTG